MKMTNSNRDIVVQGMRNQLYVLAQLFGLALLDTTVRLYRAASGCLLMPIRLISVRVLFDNVINSLQSNFIYLPARHIPLISRPSDLPISIAAPSSTTVNRSLQCVCPL